MTEDREHMDREREEVLSEYGGWRLADVEDSQVVEEIRTLETLLRLKAEQLGSPDPGLWTEQLAAALLTEVVPRTVVQPREQVMDLVPTLIRFARFLRESGRWHPASVDPAAAAEMLGGLEFATLEAADDPTRRSFSTNILSHGLTLGVDLEDEEDLVGYMHWYNSLPDAERIALSETGRLEDPSTPYDRENALREVRSDGLLMGSWPWFLPDPEGGDDMLADGEDGADGAALLAHADNEFVRRSLVLLEHISAAPRKITGTGALSRPDCMEVLARLGLPTSLRTMWERPELVGPWVTLLDGGWLELVGRTVRSGPGPVPYAVPEAGQGERADEGEEAFTGFAHALLTAALLGKDARSAEDGGFRGMPDTLAALLVACTPAGLEMPGALPPGPGEGQVPLDPSTGEWDREELQRLFAVRRDLDDLAAMGVLECEGRRFSGSSAVRGALAAMLRERGSSGPEG